jgi:hypothetical protein
MWKILIGVAVMAGSTGAQTYRDLLLPEARHINGTVVDHEGKPVGEARIDHSNDRQLVHQTDSQGTFAFDTRAPSLVVRKAGFRSALIQTRAATEVQITLQTSTSQSFPNCSDTRRFDSLEGWGASFWFPKIPGVKASRQGRDIDYGIRSYFVKTKQDPKGIRHGSGSLWGFGIPSNLDVWQSARYEETTFNSGDLTIVDARGQLPNGNRWRYLGKFGESAEYSNVDKATAKVLDQVLDGACSTRPR